MTGPPRSAATPHDDRGAATVLAVACVGLLLVVAVVVGEVGALVRAHRSAQAAADLAALAGASSPDGCAAAARVAADNDARMSGCRAAGVRDVVVTVVVDSPAGWWSPAAGLVAEARAGPG